MKEKKKKDPKKKKRALIITGSILGVFALFVITVVMITIIGDKANIKRAESYDPVGIENQLVPEKDENGYWTFTTDRDLKIMQLTDIHLGGGWLSLKKDSQAINAVATMIQAEKPDLVIITGDMAFPVFFKAATFNNKLPAKEIAALMEHLGVYWTVAFGNHDTEAYSYYSREQISDFYGNSGFKYCLFQKGPDDVDGYGNQVINVKNSKGILTQSLYIFDSHSYTDGDFLGMMWKYDNIHENQGQRKPHEQAEQRTPQGAGSAREFGCQVPRVLPYSADRTARRMVRIHGKRLQGHGKCQVCLRQSR